MPSFRSALLSTSLTFLAVAPLLAQSAAPIAAPSRSTPSSVVDHGWSGIQRAPARRDWDATRSPSFSVVAVPGAASVVPGLDPSPNRRRNVVLGAAVGAIVGVAVAAKVCDGDGLCLYSPVVLLPLGGAAAGMIAALLLTPVR
jgi:hypothetical protein